ncbi:hypothetical protein IE53DRAFT_371037 [Violaceomyces palustris]|uniref:Uncharacterized protein n=1 Tax=Violaceomyces palustris TaxID=1673888 RepID=A0ACD0NQ77_9BASI|nr:hypothetical protein IE53DRAFT_371037 [Violaceomyces palustris]
MNEASSQRSLHETSLDPFHSNPHSSAFPSLRSKAFHLGVDSRVEKEKADRKKQKRKKRERQPTLAEALDNFSKTKFRNHARWISKHQISTLLICSLVICSLFYPAVGIYFWASKGGPGVSRGDAASVWRSLSTPFMDSFVSSGRKHINSIRDLRMIWDDVTDLDAKEAQDSFLADDKFLTSARCRTLHVEHILVTTDDVLVGQGPKHGVLNKPILNSALQLQRAIESLAGHSGPFATRVRCAIPSGSLQHATTASASSDDGTSSPPPTPPCLTLSPLEYWDMDAEAVQADDNPATTLLSSSRNQTSQGIPLSVATTLAGRWHLFRKLPRAEYLALTFFLEADDASDDICGRGGGREGSEPGKKTLSGKRESHPHRGLAGRENSDSHKAWMDLLRVATSGGTTLIPADQKASKEVYLKFAPKLPSSSLPLHRILLGVGYVIVIIYILRGLVKMKKVHSRFGLAFTGSIELLISMIMSVSICALLGIRLTLVPWEILPFVIVVVGSENMFALTKAVVDTPLSLTVSSRMAYGLSKAGGPITVTVLSDILLLIVIAWLIGVRAVREFCAFAIVSLVMDYFMQMTFFVTILSIDMQRLELADLLTQGARNSRAAASAGAEPGWDPSAAATTTAVASTVPGNWTGSGEEQHSGATRGSSNFLKTCFRAIWRARTARTASLSLLLAFMSGLYLYYGTGYTDSAATVFQPYHSLNPPFGAGGRVRDDDAAAALLFDPFSHLPPDALSAPPWWASSPSARFWQAANPSGAAQLRILIEPWTIVSLRSPPRSDVGGGLSAAKKSFAVWALFRPRIRAIIWFSKLVILPISGTTGLLWLLLLYLLKDTELLDAQRDRSEADAENGDDGRDRTGFFGNKEENHGADVDGVGGGDFEVELETLAGLHASDVDLVSESLGTIVSVDTESVISIWTRRVEAKGDDESRKRSRRTKLRLASIRVNMETDVSPVTAVAVSSRAGLIVVGLASGRVCIISLLSHRLIYEGRPGGSPSESLPRGKDRQEEGEEEEEERGEVRSYCSPPSAVQHISLHHRESLESIDSAGVVSVHRNGSAFEWLPSRKSAAQVIKPRIETTWTGFDLGSPTLRRRRRTLALSSSDRRLEIWQQTEAGGTQPFARVFQIPRQERSFYRCVALCDVGGGKDRPSDPEHGSSSEANQGQLVIAGLSSGLLQILDLTTGQLLSSFDLADGPVSKVRVAQDEDLCSATVVAMTATRVSVLRIGASIHLGAGLAEGAGDGGALVSGVPGSPHRRLRTPVGSGGGGAAGQNGGVGAGGGGSLLSPPGFWSEDSAPTTPTSEMPGTASYPMSSHGGARNRRASSHGGRDRSSMVVSDSSGFLGPSTMATATSQDSLAFNGNEPLIAAEGSLSSLSSLSSTLHLVGCVLTHRGGADLVNGRMLLGIRMRRREADPDSTRNRGAVGGSTSGGGGSGTRWECWSLDLSSNFTVGRGGDIHVQVSPLQLDRVEALPFNNKGKLLVEGGGGGKGRVALRFGTMAKTTAGGDVRRARGDQGSTDVEPDGTIALAFTRVYPVVGVGLGGGWDERPQVPPASPSGILTFANTVKPVREGGSFGSVNSPSSSSTPDHSRQVSSSMVTLNGSNNSSSSSSSSSSGGGGIITSVGKAAEEHHPHFSPDGDVASLVFGFGACVAKLSMVVHASTGTSAAADSRGGGSYSRGSARRLANRSGFAR